MDINEEEYESMFKAIGIRVKKYRKKKKLTQEKLAELIDISYSHMRNIESGASFSIQTLIRICNELDTTADAILLDSIYNSKERLNDELALLTGQCTDKEMKLAINIIEAIIKSR